ncbi:MAG: glycerol-3-phosphate 1-O-acyltransferase PlsY [Bacteroidales bacterium]|nr:glycerol-3-phosphate 1-O-acyltransferase PlsY [Bacteroidales bacterium]
MEILKVVLFILGAYLIGSISTAVWIGKIFFDTDIREEGSGNAGFTNAVRVLGWKAGIPVFVIDVLKGFFAVSLVKIFHVYSPSTSAFVNYQLILGAAAVLGHIFPLYAGFRGGKGVATLLGIAFGIAPLPTLVCMGVFLIVFTSTRYVSLASMTAGLAFPVTVIFIFKTSVISLIIFSVLVSILLIITHQKNIERLLRREESRANFRRKRRHH